jgi:hypothetical protein
MANKILSYTLDFSKVRVNELKNRGSPDNLDFPEIIFDNVILVSNKSSEFKYDSVDRITSIIYPEGCENLNSPETVFVNMDFRHGKLENAGYVANMSLNNSKDQILGVIKIGEQHQLIDKQKKVYGSAYASAWMSIAEKLASTSEAIKNAQTYKDFIPPHIFEKYFRGQVVPPLTGISVELDWNTDPEIINGITHIKKYSIVRVSFLVNDKTGQQQSRINPQNFKLINTKIRMNDEQILNWDIAVERMLEVIPTVFSDDLTKIRDANLGKESTDLKVIYERMCSACMANQKAIADTATKKRSEQDIIDAITALKTEIEMMKAESAKLKTADEVVMTTPASVDTGKVRSEQDVMDAISNLTSLVTDLQTKFDTMQANDMIDEACTDTGAIDPLVRDGETTKAVEVASEPEETPLVVLTPTEPQKVRWVAEKLTYDPNKY